MKSMICEIFPQEDFVIRSEGIKIDKCYFANCGNTVLYSSAPSSVDQTYFLYCNRLINVESELNLSYLSAISLRPYSSDEVNGNSTLHAPYELISNDINLSHCGVYGEKGIITSSNCGSTMSRLCAYECSSLYMYTTATNGNNLCKLSNLYFIYNVITRSYMKDLTETKISNLVVFNDLPTNLIENSANVIVEDVYHNGMLEFSDYGNNNVTFTRIYYQNSIDPEIEKTFKGIGQEGNELFRMFTSVHEASCDDYKRPVVIVKRGVSTSLLPLLATWW